MKKKNPMIQKKELHQQRKEKVKNLKFQWTWFPSCIPLLVRRNSQFHCSRCHCNHTTNLAKLRKTTLRTQQKKLLIRYPTLRRTRNLRSQQNHRKTNLAKLRKTILLAQKRKLLTRYAKMGARNLRSQQNHRKTNPAKLRKTILLAQKRKLLTRYANMGAQNLGSQQISAKPI